MMHREGIHWVSTTVKSIEEIATMIGRGEAMSSDWCLDGTLSCLLEA